MAYMNQAKKKVLVENAKKVLKKYGVKATFSVRNHMVLVCSIKSGSIDFFNNMKEHETRANVKPVTSAHVNPYWYQEHYTGIAKDFLTELFSALNEGNHDNSDSMTDYFDVGWYLDVDIGQWNKPYILN